jgi:hypothetical protein
MRSILNINENVSTQSQRDNVIDSDKAETDNRLNLDGMIDHRFGKTNVGDIELKDFDSKNIIENGL